MPLQGRNPRSKRPREHDADEDSQDNDVAPESQRRRITAPSPNTTALKTPFACPFAKHDPRIYMKKRTCCGPGWADIGRVKEHLYRCHSLPRYSCPRCFWTCESQVELNGHSRANPPCKTLEHDPNPNDGLNEDQKARIRSRKYIVTGPNPPTESDKWKQIYRICFPTVAEDQIPSPFYATTSSQPVDDDNNDFEDFLHRHMALTIRQLIRVEISQNTQLCQDSDPDTIVEFVAELLPRMMSRMYSAYLVKRGQGGGGGQVGAPEPVRPLTPLSISPRTAISPFNDGAFPSFIDSHSQGDNPMLETAPAQPFQHSPTTDLRFMNILDGDLLKDLMWVDMEKYRM